MLQTLGAICGLEVIDAEEVAIHGGSVLVTFQPAGGPRFPTAGVERMLDREMEAGLDRPEVQIVPRTDDAARYGISTDQISEAVRVATIGDIDANLAKFNAGDRLIPIRVQLTEASRANLRLIEALGLTTATGGMVPLAAVANVSFGQGPSSIDRYDRVRRVTGPTKNRPPELYAIEP